MITTKFINSLFNDKEFILINSQQSLRGRYCYPVYRDKLINARSGGAVM